MRQKLMRIVVLGSALLILGLSTASPASAYGNAHQWEITFSANCTNTSLCPAAASGVFPSLGTWGVHGWCTWGGSDGSSAVGTTGNTADCQFTFYSRPPVNDVTHFSYDVTSWKIGTGSAFLPPGTPSFFVTGGTFKARGPGAAILGDPTGVSIPFPSPCPPLFCDLGNPSIPGHYAFTPFQGYHAKIQVNKLP
jgi:hypothetical protein